MWVRIGRLSVGDVHSGTQTERSEVVRGVSSASEEFFSCSDINIFHVGLGPLLDESAGTPHYLAWQISLVETTEAG
jgi:hypothetical protein